MVCGGETANAIKFINYIMAGGHLEKSASEGKAMWARVAAAMEQDGNGTISKMTWLLL